MTRKLLIFVALVLAVAIGAAPASAHWTAGGSGVGNGSAAVLAAGNQPTATASLTTATVSWAQTSFQGSNLGGYTVGGYKLMRYPAAGGSAVTPGGTCANTINGVAATLSCQEPGVPAGDWKYAVTPVLNSWTGAESTKSATLTVTAPPVPTGVTATAIAAAGVNVSWTAASGASGYNIYRRISTGAYNYSSPLNGGTPVSGTTFADNTAVNGVTYRYVVRSVFTGSIESADSVEAAAVTADGAAPTAVSITDPGSPLRGSVTLNAGATDSGSGIASVRFQYATAGGSTWTDACTATISPFTCSGDTTAVTDGLYDLRVIATDNVGNTTTSASVTNRRIDNTIPTVAMTTPAARLRATVSLSATASDAGSGLASLVIQRAATGTSTWTTICTTATSPNTCSWNTTLVSDGGYDLRAVATDAAGNSATSTLISNRIVDNTAPTGTDIQAVNSSTTGRPSAGDKIVYTFSEPVLSTSVLAGWDGTALAVTARLTNATPDTFTVYNSANTVLSTLGSVQTSTKYVTSNVTFNSSSLLMSGNSITLTLGTPSSGITTDSAAITMKWLTATGLTDLAGNPMTSATVSESGTLDVDF